MTSREIHSGQTRPFVPGSGLVLGPGSNPGVLGFIVMGLLAAFAGIILSSRMHASRPGTGEGMELNVIAAVILGGTSLFGGKGTIIGSLVGALVIGALNNGLIILGFSTHVQMLVRGLVIILAVLFARE